MPDDIRRCSVEGCDREHFGRSYCRKHYKRWRHHGTTDSLKAIPLATRLWPKVTVRGGDACWPFTGYIDPKGYGNISLSGSLPTGAHRAAWIVTYGWIPDDLVVCHRCDNPPCCRPDHLFLGTQMENVRDASAKGRMGKTNPAQRREMLARYLAGERSGSIGADYGISGSTVRTLAGNHRRLSQSANNAGS